ncbi:MAG TPA: CinA family protein [Candidatus Sulfotelmatobacter sp.]|nr:CinA family protein [Candidatus Sulfotelmatobacter sp.]
MTSCTDGDSDVLLGPRLAELFPDVREVAAVLTDKRLTVAVAESCTGGLLGAVLTSVPGSSSYFRGGVIAYANEIKSELLGVEAELIGRHGAVSPEVAASMAEGARRFCDAEIGIGVTGVAGPDSGGPDKPAGLIHVAAAWGGQGRHLGDRHVELRLEGGREENRAAAVRAGLRLLVEIASSDTW